MDPLRVKTLDEAELAISRLWRFLEKAADLNHQLNLAEIIRVVNIKLNRIEMVLGPARGSRAKSQTAEARRHLKALVSFRQNAIEILGSAEAMEAWLNTWEEGYYKTRRELAMRPQGLRQIMQYLMIPGKVVIRAMEICGSEARAKEWLNSPLIALGGRSPREVIQLQGTSGVELVLDELGRIEQGVIA